MTALLILKQKIKEFYGEHDTWILPILKFILAFGLFKGIDTSLGFMGKLDNIFVVPILALICSVMPINAMTILGCVLINRTLLRSWYRSCWFCPASYDTADDIISAVYVKR